MRKVLITGITGFIGAHIAENLISNNIEVIGLKRKNSDTWRCKEFIDKIHWLDIDEAGIYKEWLIEFEFDTMIHSAWIGVGADERDNLIKQSENIDFLAELLALGKKCGMHKFIFMGSQAEYGSLDGKISETQPALPLNEYGVVKLKCLEMSKDFCNVNHVSWIWLRLFSLFGEKEGNNWLIPSIINRMLIEGKMDFTLGEQKYAYLYIKDFASIVSNLVIMPVESGIYNVSSNNLITIRSLIENIRDRINPDFQLNFGALAYRKNQSMHIEGDINKLYSQIGEIEFTDFNVALQNTLNYYTNN